jgi:hypothetical protein
MRHVPLDLAGLRVVPAGLAACLATCLVSAGCGSATAPQAGSAPGSAAHTSAPAPTGTPAPGTGAPGTGPSGTPASGAGAPSGCQGSAPAAGALTITLAGNG